MTDKKTKTKRTTYKMDPVVTDFVAKLQKDTNLTKNQVTEALLFEMYKFAQRSLGLTNMVITNYQTLESNKALQNGS
tara:strand:- start:198 stop:428 length:231 start_codon:yes stop_codon:yes gene_type:complete